MGYPLIVSVILSSADSGSIFSTDLAQILRVSHANGQTLIEIHTHRLSSIFNDNRAPSIAKNSFTSFADL